MTRSIGAHLCAIFILTLLAAGCSATKEDTRKTAEERFAEGKRLFDEGDYAEAIQQFDIVKLQFQGSSVSDKAQYYTGLARYKREEYHLASYDFELLIRNYPSSPLVPDAYFMSAECYVGLSPDSQRDQTYTQRALEALQTFIELYPASPRVPEAQKEQAALIEKLARKEYETAMLYERMEDYKAAQIYYDRVLDQYYNTSYADASLLGKIRVLIARKKPADAARAADLFLKKFPNSPLRDTVERYRKELPPPAGASR